MENSTEDRRLGPREAARFCDFLCMHGYPLYADFAESPTDGKILPFLGLVTRWLGDCDVLFAEFGVPALPTEGSNSARARSSTLDIPVLEAEDAAAFTRRTLENLRAFGFLGAMLWCYGDYGEVLWGCPPLDEAPHERWFGLWGANGLPKPAVEEIQRFQGLPWAPQRLDLGWIDMAPEDFYTIPRRPSLYRELRTRLGGETPPGVPRSCRTDSNFFGIIGQVFHVEYRSGH